MSIESFKAAAYDRIAIMQQAQNTFQQAQNELNEINQQIVSAVNAQQPEIAPEAQPPEATQ